MLVYGDPSFETTTGDYVERLRQSFDSFSEVDAARQSQQGIEQFRTLLIALGQLEQGVADSDGSLEQIGLVMRATDNAAAVFVDGLDNPQRSESANAINQGLASLSDVPIRIKIPEGFAFYGLMPEQYVLAAQRWIEVHRGRKGRVLVVGIRSIGTTLSAVVATVLRQHGWATQRVTVRPHGDPFRREAVIDQSLLESADFAVVVDEGPGASGSSMAAVAAALCRHGMDREQISFLPGHNNEPGRASSEDIAYWWRVIPRYFVSLADVRWHGQPLTDLLVRETTRLFPGNNISIADISAGKWREFVYRDASLWPAVCPPFERMKFLCSTNDGQKILWRFAGLGCGSDGEMDLTRSLFRQWRRRSEVSCLVAPVAMCNGFIASPWIEGTRLQAVDANDAGVLQTISNYAVNASGQPMNRREADSAFERLQQILYANTEKALGGDWVERARFFVARVTSSKELRRYGDGRMAPHEWIRTTIGAIVKTDGVGHDCDHTIVGTQSVLWDLAGILVEWDLNDGQADRVLSIVRNRDVSVTCEELHLYVAAYLAFRIAASSICSGQFDTLHTNQVVTRRYIDKLRALLHDAALLAV